MSRSIITLNVLKRFMGLDVSWSAARRRRAAREETVYARYYLDYVLTNWSTQLFTSSDSFTKHNIKNLQRLLHNFVWVTVSKNFVGVNFKWGTQIDVYLYLMREESVMNTITKCKIDECIQSISQMASYLVSNHQRHHIINLIIIK